MNDIFLVGDRNITKSININALPPEAWNIITGGDDNEKQKVWEKVGLLYRCIEICQSEMQNMPFSILSQSTGNEIWKSDEKEIPIGYEYLENLSELIGLSEASLLICSRAFWHKENNGLKIKELRWMAPLSIVPIWDKVKGLIGFKRKINGNTINFTIEEMVSFIKLNPMAETEIAKSPVEACTASALVLLALDEFLSTFIKRGLTKATILTVEGNPSQKDKEELKSMWNKIMTGVKNVFGTAVLSASVKPVIIGEGLKDLENDVLIKSKKEDIASTMGIPLSLVLSNAANYATSLVDKKNFYDNRILPDAKFIQTQANKYLFDDLDLYLEFNPETLSLFQEDEAQRAKAFSDYVAAGMQPSIAASILGIDLPHGIEYANLDGMPITDFKSYTVKAKYDGLDKERNKIEQKGIEILQNAFVKIVNYIVAPKGLQDNTSDNLTVDVAIQRYKEASKSILKDSLDKFLHEALDLGIQEGIRLTEETIGFGKQATLSGVDWTLVNQNALDWLYGHLDDMLIHLDETSVNIVSVQVGNWITNGLPLNELKNNLIRYGFSENRAEAISVTEVTRVYAEGNRFAFKQAPFPVGIRWNTAADEIVCKICRPLHNHVIDIDGTFFNELPQDVQESLGERTFEIMPAHVKCRCWITPVIL